MYYSHVANNNSGKNAADEQFFSNSPNGILSDPISDLEIANLSAHSFEDDLDHREFPDHDIEEAEVNEDAPERWQTAELSDFFNETYHDCFPDALAQEVHNFVRLIAHPYRRCFDRPAKSPKNQEIESAIRNKGTPGCCTFQREDGKFIVRPLAEWMCFGNNLRRKHYYTSDNRIALLYHDVDCHLDYQTQADADAARSLIEKETTAHLCVSPLFLRSDRGENGYLKVDLAGVDPKKANEVFDEYQEAIRLLFAKHGVMADFEIKGTVTWIDGDGKLHAGRYGKLPMCASRWDNRWHRSLVTAKRVTISQIEAFIKKVKAEVSGEDIARHDEAKHRAFITHHLPVGDKQQWPLITRMSLGIYEDSLVSYQRQSWIARSLLDDATITKLWPDYEPNQKDNHEERHNVENDCPIQRPGRTLRLGTDEQDRGGERASAIGAENLQSDGRNHGVPGVVDRRVGTTGVYVADLLSEPDSFKRQLIALLRLARFLKRVPTVEEALDFIRDNGLYTGAWANPARRGRVRGILRHIAKTFDAKKCSKPGRTQATVNIGKYDSWAKAKFPKGLVGGKRRIVTDEFEIKEINRCGRIEWEFISVFVSVCEFLLLADKRPDESLPHERAMKLWNHLHKQGVVQVQFDNRKWAVCRDQLEKYGIVKVTDRNYESNKAMKWAVGMFFPSLGLWKTKKEPSLLGPISVDEFIKGMAITTETRQGQHNSLLHQQSNEGLVLSLFGTARPPPGINSG